MIKIQILNNNKRSNILKSVVWIFVICLGFITSYLGFAPPAHAQTLGLSISPPINEIMIIPGKNVTQNFTISNNGIDGYASIYIVPFSAQGEYGGILLNEENLTSKSSQYSSWFDIVSPKISFGEKFYIRQGEATTISIKFSPPEDAIEKDYYFTLIYQLESDSSSGFSSTGTINQARIGANLLVSLSKNGLPIKSFEISEFSAPKIIDSLSKIKYRVRIKNTGLHFFKSNGNISVSSTLGPDETLELAPFNIVSNSVRNIPCIRDENTFECQSSNKVFLGVYKATLKVNPDGGENSQEKTATTVALPFSLIGAGILIYLIYKVMKKPKNIE